jgi:hypothetical protein
VESLLEDSESPRHLMLHNIDPMSEMEAVRVGDWKLIKGV